MGSPRRDRSVGWSRLGWKYIRASEYRVRGSGGLTTAGRSPVLGLGPEDVASPCSLEFRVVGQQTGVKGSPRGIEAPVVLGACAGGILG